MDSRILRVGAFLASPTVGAGRCRGAFFFGCERVRYCFHNEKDVSISGWRESPCPLAMLKEDPARREALRLLLQLDPGQLMILQPASWKGDPQCITTGLDLRVGFGDK